MSNLAERIYKITKAHSTLNSKAKLAEYLGCSRSMLYNYEQESYDVPGEILDKLTKLEVILGIGASTNVQLDSGLGRRIPVVGWAHAGSAVAYEEIASPDQELIPTDCRDPRAFAVYLEGDSMEPSFREGDLLVLMPTEEAYSGCYVVCRFVDDGVIFRRMEFMRDKTIRLVPLNDRYEPTIHDRSEFSWIYPVWGRWSQLWR